MPGGLGLRVLFGLLALVRSSLTPVLFLPQHMRFTNGLAQHLHLFAQFLGSQSHTRDIKLYLQLSGAGRIHAWGRTWRVDVEPGKDRRRFHRGDRPNRRNNRCRTWRRRSRSGRRRGVRPRRRGRSERVVAEASLAPAAGLPLPWLPRGLRKARLQENFHFACLHSCYCWMSWAF